MILRVSRTSTDVDCSRLELVVQPNPRHAAIPGLACRPARSLQCHQRLGAVRCTTDTKREVDDIGGAGGSCCGGLPVPPPNDREGDARSRHLLALRRRGESRVAADFQYVRAIAT